MAARFWVGGSGNLDGSDTSHIAATSGGTPGASYPGVGDDLTFDANSGGGTVDLTAALNMNSITYGQFTGRLNFNAQPVTTVTHSLSGTGTRTIDWGSAVITVTGSGGTPFNGATITGLTFIKGTSKLVFTGGSFTMSAGSMTFYDIEVTGSGAPNLNFVSCRNFTRTGTAAKTDGLMLSQSSSVTGVCTLNSNSSINRLLIQSTTVGTARIFTVASLVCSGVIEFQDITGAGAATWTTAASGATYFGDCGGNSGITMTTPATQNLTMSTNKNYSDVTVWTSRVPLPQDPVTATGWTAGNLTVDMPRLGKDIDLSGATSTGTLGLALAFAAFGDWKYSSTFSITGGGNGTLRAIGASTINMAGKSFGGIINISTRTGGSYSLAAALSGGNQINISGSFTSNNFAITGLTVSIAGITAGSLGTSNISLTSTATGTIFTGGSGISFSGITITVANTSTNTRTLALGSNINCGTINYILAGSTGGLDITATGAGATIANLNFSDANNARTLRFGVGVTYNIGNFNGVRGLSGKVITVSPAAAGTYTLSSSNIQSTDFINISGAIGAGSGEWHAGQHSTDGGSNTNIRFSRIKSIRAVQMATLKSLNGIDIERSRSINGALMD